VDNSLGQGDPVEVLAAVGCLEPLLVDGGEDVGRESRTGWAASGPMTCAASPVATAGPIDR
jgi:hypothetical protein